MNILFFSVHAAIWPHALPENRLVRELRNAGHEITYVTCNRAFRDHCTSMSAYGYEPSLPAERKDEVCRACIKNADILAKGNRAKHIELADYLTPSDEISVSRFVDSVSADAYLQARWNEIDIGKIAAYELFLKFKKMSTSLQDEEWDYYQTYLKNTLRSGIGFEKILDDYRPDVVFCYSPQYAVNGIAAELAAKRGASVYFIEGSSNNAERYEALRVWDWTRNGLLNPGLSHWSEAERRVTSEDVGRVHGHFTELFSATSFAVYSSPLQPEFSTREFFNVPENAKIVLATLSSFDEAFAAVVIEKFPEGKLKSNVFATQFDWIQKTFEYIDGRDDIFLIVRVHPRDYPNKRETVQSEQAKHWERILTNRPANVGVNWPQQNISLYNILRDVDAVATGWSATGVEALAFGIPVVTYDRDLPSYPPEIHYTGESENEYYANFERVLGIGSKIEHAIGAFKWLAITFSMGTVRINRSYLTEKALEAAKRRLKAYPKIVVKLDNALVRFQARQAMPHREDAARLRKLVEKRSFDLIAIAIEDRPAQSADVSAKIVADQIRDRMFAAENQSVYRSAPRA